MGRRAVIVVTLVLAAACAGGGGEDESEEPDCPPESTGETTATATTLDPRCVEGAEEAADDEDDDDDENGERSTWTGSFHMESTGALCTSSYDGDAEVDVDADGGVAGTVSAMGSYTCVDAGTFPESGTAGLRGTLDDNEFVLTTPDATLGLATICFADREVKVPVEGDFASTEFTIDPGGGDVYTCRLMFDQAPG